MSKKIRFVNQPFWTNLPAFGIILQLWVTQHMFVLCRAFSTGVRPAGNQAGQRSQSGA